MELTLLCHKPLISIFKPTHEPPAIIQKWILRLQPYTFTVEALPGTLNAPDVLSRSPLKDNQSDYLSEEAEQYDYFVAEQSMPKVITLDEVESESSKNDIFSKIRLCLKTNKWPAHDKSLSPYFKIRSEHGNLLLRGSKLIIPHKLQESVLSILHETHQGIYRSKAVLREKVWRAVLFNDVERLISNCGVYQRLSHPAKPPPIQPTELPNKPWL